jgi:hypothetical protein
MSPHTQHLPLIFDSNLSFETGEYLLDVIASFSIFNWSSGMFNGLIVGVGCISDNFYPLLCYPVALA